jgi:N-acetyl-alpha-D-glucosaminyl L-malate synthase BshA
VVATELGRELARRGHVVHIISYDQPFRLREFSPNILYHQVEVPSYPLFKHPPYLLSLANKMAEVAVYGELDLLHVHYAIPHAASAYLARQMLASRDGGRARRLKFITTLHGTDITLVGSEPSYAEMVAFTINESDGVTAVSEALRQETLRTFQVTREIVTVHNFIDPGVYRPEPDRGKRRCFAADDEKIVLHVSNFRPVKRVDAVVQVFAQLAAAVRARLLMVGDGPDLPVARQEAERLGVGDRVCFLGQQDEVAGLFSLADLFLLPSATESFGLSALEAMACGVPVIASRVGGLPEVVGDRAAGFLYPPDRLDRMANQAIALLTNDALHGKVSRAARRRAAERFSADRLVAEYEAYYRLVLDQP